MTYLLIALAVGISVNANAALGTTVQPVIVEVLNSQGMPIAGARITLTQRRLDEMIGHEPDEARKRLLLFAKDPKFTNQLGHAIVYCVAGFITGDEFDAKGIAADLAGALQVDAEGFKSQTVQFRRNLFTAPEGPTSVTLQLSIELAKH